MRCEGLLLSDSVTFDDLSAVSDIYIPACGAWVGDYPYLDKPQFRAFMASKLRKEKMKVMKLAPGPRELSLADVAESVFPSQRASPYEAMEVNWDDDSVSK